MYRFVHLQLLAIRGMTGEGRREARRSNNMPCALWNSHWLIMGNSDSHRRDRLRTQTVEWLQKKCAKQELLSIVCQLQTAATVVWPGRMFVRQLFNISVPQSRSFTSYLSESRSPIGFSLVAWIFGGEEWSSMLSALGDQQLSHFEHIWIVRV